MASPSGIIPDCPVTGPWVKGCLDAMAGRAPVMSSHGFTKEVEQYVRVMAMAGDQQARQWNTPTYETAKRWAGYMQKAIVRLADPAEIKQVDAYLADVQRVQGIKLELSCRALLCAPALLYRALLLNRFTPAKLLPTVWADLANAPIPPPCAACADPSGLAGSELLRAEVERARRLDEHIAAASRVASVLDSTSRSLSAFGSGHVLPPGTEDGGAPKRGAAVPVTCYAFAQRMTVGRLLREEIISRFPEGEREQLIEWITSNILPYGRRDSACLEVLACMLIAGTAAARTGHARARAPGHDELAAELDLRGARHAVDGVLLDHLLAEDALRAQLWRVHPWVLARLSALHFRVCAPHLARLLECTACALDDACAAHGVCDAASAHAGGAELQGPRAWPLDACAAHWEHLIALGAHVARLATRALAELRATRTVAQRIVLDAHVLERLAHDAHAAVLAEQAPSAKRSLSACAQERARDAPTEVDEPLKRAGTGTGTAPGSIGGMGPAGAGTGVQAGSGTPGRKQRRLSGGQRDPGREHDAP